MFTTYERYSTGLRSHMGRGFIRPLIKILILFVVLYLVLTSMFLTAYQVQSVSMQPLLEPRDRLLVSPVSRYDWLRRFSSLALKRSCATFSADSMRSASG